VLQLDATEAEVRRRSASGALRRADVVAFATHGLVAGELGRGGVAEPALALTPPRLPNPDMLDPDNDGLLTASEAAALDLKAQWLILSACNTAAGGAPDAESLSGLARAFFYAGARSILASHFPVFDAAAPLLTGEAVRLARAGGTDRPTAMRQAMAQLIANEGNDAAGYSFAHPKAWASFAVIDAD
jgi:CHAT domain-containing protein